MTGSLGDEPDPATASTPAEFVQLLNQLRVWAGKPSLRRLQRLAGQIETAGGDRVDALPMSTVSYVLTGKGLPRLPRMAFVEAFVTACFTACGHPREEVVDRVGRWVTAWRAIAVPSDAEPPAPAPGTDISTGIHHQLPMDIGEYTGRSAELARLTELVDTAARTAKTVTVVAIEGMAGVGKTRFAVHAAHEFARAGRFDEIQLWADLRGFDPRRDRADPAEMLERFLRLLGVPGQRIPQDLEERAALYRERLADRRCLVLLDNAADEDQVRPLIPAGPHCLVLVTTRHDLPGLDGLQRLSLDVFSADEARTLLSRVAGAERVAAEPAEARRIVELCGCLPIAVALAARRLRTRAAWRLADLADRLAADDRRLDQFDSRDRHVRVSFDLSYRALTPAQRRIFRLLGLHPGEDLTADTAAALTGTSVEEAEPVLEALLDEHLLQQATAGRYRFHDLLRRYARDRTHAEDTPEQRQQAVAACVGWLLHTADSAWAALDPHRRRTFPLVPYHGPHRPREFSSHEDALAWCETERATLVAAVRAAADERLLRIAWQLPSVLLRFFYLRSHWADWIATHRTGLAAARESADRLGEAKILNGLGVAYGDLRRFGEAIDCCRDAAEIFGAVGDTYSQAWSLNNLGVTSIDDHDPEAAVGHFEQALVLFRRHDALPGEAICLNNLGDALRRLGRQAEAIGHLRQAVDLQQRLGDRTGLRYTLCTLGDLYRDTGQHDKAVDHYEQALAANRAAGDRWGVGRVSHRLGRTLAALSRQPDADEHLRQALAIFDDLGAPEAAIIREELGIRAELGSGHESG